MEQSLNAKVYESQETHVEHATAQIVTLCHSIFFKKRVTERLLCQIIFKRMTAFNFKPWHQCITALYSCFTLFKQFVWISAVHVLLFLLVLSAKCFVFYNFFWLFLSLYMACYRSKIIILTQTLQNICTAHFPNLLWSASLSCFEVLKLSIVAVQ